MMAAAVEEPIENARSKLAALKAKRDELETELLNLYSQLRKHNVTMTEPLVDGEGYPRSDIDVYTIRHIRHEIICKQNDCQALTEEMRLGLYALHMEEKKTVNTVDPTLRPFAWVDQIDDNSPAQKANLCVGDHIVKFGNLCEKNFADLNTLKQFVDANLRKCIHVYVLRNERLCPLVLIPDEWNGNGYLGDGKLSQFFKSPYEIAPAAEWTDVSAKLFSLAKPLLQMEIIDLQEDISFYMYKTASPE